MIALRLLVSTLALSVALGPLAACKSERSDATSGPAPAPSGAPALPPLVVRDGSQGLTFSYITLDGGFQLAKKVADVPYEARDSVRVWSEVSGDGIAGPWVYVADLRNQLPDGAYKVEVLSRAAFDALAAERRDKSKKAPAKPAEPAAKAPDPTAAPTGSAVAKGKLKVIIYGADWCKPCHMAENYLKSKGIPFEHKDIDDPETNEEMRIKLQEAGIKTHSIPVLDVNGKLLVGFSEPELDKALAAAGAG
jgi:glutaredoxin